METGQIWFVLLVAAGVIIAMLAAICPFCVKA